VEQTERERLLRRLVEWRPAAGILSVYVHIDPGDRGRGWRIALRERLHALAEETSPHGERRAFEAAAAQVLERFPENGAPPERRGHAGFIEVAEKRPTAVWRSMQMAPRRVEVVRSSRPYVRPLVELFADGPHVGVVLVSADRVRLLDWSLGAIRGLHDWEITLFSRDWRERKAERSIPGAGTRTSASGRDQFGQRLEANRQRFLHEIGSLVGKQHAERRWSHLIAYGDEDHARELAEGLGDAARRLHIVPQDLVSAKEGDVAERVAAEVRELNTSQALALIHEVEEAIGAEPGAALGPQETLEALAEGRARHVVFAAERDYDGRPFEADLSYDDGTDDGLPVTERMVELAVSTDAGITPVYEEPAAKLEPRGGVAALLRY
jgi:Bacterial archaeo-eukaryotic release factor family 5